MRSVIGIELGPDCGEPNASEALRSPACAEPGAVIDTFVDCPGRSVTEEGETVPKPTKRETAASNSTLPT